MRPTEEALTFEHQMFERLNRDRATHGLPKLAYDEQLADVARAHSFDMIQHGFFSHESPTTGVLEDRMDRAGFLASEMRENLAVAPTIDRAEDNLLKSPGHRRNILADSISHLGIGIVRGDGSGDDRVLTITQVFARPASVESPGEAEDKVLGLLQQGRARAGQPPLTTHPMLAELADEHIPDLPDDVPSGAVSDIGDAVSAVLNQRDDHGLGAVQILGQAVFEVSEFTTPDSIGDPQTVAIGIAAREARDDRGRPRLKILVLVGRR